MRHQSLQDAPSCQVGKRTVDEDDEVAGRFSLEAQERHVGFGSVVKEVAAYLVDGLRTDATSHTVDAGHGAHGFAREQVAGHREQIG